MKKHLAILIFLSFVGTAQAMEESEDNKELTSLGSSLNALSSEDDNEGGDNLVPLARTLSNMALSSDSDREEESVPCFSSPYGEGFAASTYQQRTQASSFSDGFDEPDFGAPIVLGKPMGRVMENIEEVLAAFDKAQRESEETISEAVAAE